MKKMRKFAEGGFSAAQDEWLGGADRTDPYILARMRSAVPDEPAPTSRDFDAIDSDMVAPSRNLEPVTKTVTKSKVSVTKPKSTWEDDSKIPPMPDMPKKSVKTSSLKSRDFDTTEPYIKIPATSNIGLRQFKNMKDGGPVKKMSSGGKVKSASSRADGCAVRGKTRA
jgi:hypothetical protein